MIRENKGQKGIRREYEGLKPLSSPIIPFNPLLTLLVLTLLALFSLSTISCGAKSREPIDREIIEIEEIDVINDSRGDEAVIISEEIIVLEEAPEEGEPKYDMSDLSHWNLTVSAWEKLAEKDYEGVFVYAGKCLELYEAEAREESKSMRKFAGLGHEDDLSVVNDVATARYIMGEAYMKQGEHDKAIEQFNIVIDEYPYAQCWDPKGWFWKVAEISRKNIEKINSLRKQ